MAESVLKLNVISVYLRLGSEACWLTLLLAGVVFRRPSRSLAVPQQVANQPAVTTRTSLFESMDFDVTDPPSTGAAHSRTSSSSSGPAATTQQTKRQMTGGCETTEDSDAAGGRRSKRLRQNSSTNSNQSSLSVPAERSPIYASYSSMQRYRTRVTNILPLLCCSCHLST